MFMVADLFKPELAPAHLTADSNFQVGSESNRIFLAREVKNVV